jgi:hypothetical protein
MLRVLCPSRSLVPVAAPLVNLLRPVRFRGKARLLAPLVRRAGTETVRVHGYRMELDLSEHIQRSVYTGTYEQWETGVVRRYLRPVLNRLFLASQAVGP